jgi:hypothetical protein
MFKKFKHVIFNVIFNVILKIMLKFKNIETFLEYIDYSFLRNKIEVIISKYFQNNIICII